jgi:hypothetical protein
VSAHALVHDKRGGGETDRADPRRRERRKGRVGQRLGDQRSKPTRQREGARVKKTAPTGWPQLAESERESARGRRDLPLTGGVRVSGGAGTRARGLAGPTWAGWDALSFSFFSEFSNSFSISFSIGFSIQIQTRFQIQINSNLFNTAKNILCSA